MNLDDVTEVVGNLIGTVFGSRSAKILKRLASRVERINAMEPKIARLTDRQMLDKTKQYRRAIAELRAKDPKADEHGKVEAYLDTILEEAFALVREASKRTLGMRHFDVQLIGGMILHKGIIAEMVTGEGKTLVATLPCYLNALARRPHEYAYVHVVTVNDYLARRDADWNRPIFELLGLTCGSIQSQMDSGERHPVYACDIVYGTNSEFGFDYLRDNMKTEPERQVQQKRHFAVIDEVDSILIDEARTPLIISGGPERGITEKYEQAAQLAAHLRPVPEEEQIRIEEARLQGDFNEPEKGHYMVDEKDHSVALTARGIEECERFLGIENFYTGQHMDWPHFIDNALKAKELYKKETKYVVAPGREGKLEVIIVDEFTGRMMQGRRWSDGLHQAIEAKERLAGEKIEMEAETQTLATITIQNFFKLYKKLSGMTGTAITESKEFGKIYKLEVASIPTNRPMHRANHPDVIFGTEQEKWEAVCGEIEEHHAAGRPILVGTTSVEKSERLAGILERRGLRGKFNLLNAKNHEREAQIVGQAGALGAITVATNMAGRGTDIILRDFSIEEQIRHWQALDLAPKNFDLNRPREELEEHLLGFWAKKFLDEQAYKETPAGERRAALEEYWRAHDHPPLRLAEGVRELDGLHIIGSERHEARRIDNQLRGRAGRQGDPGSSRFFLCLDDDLMRIFAKDWVRKFLRNSGMKDGAAIESKLVSRSIAKAQRRVEEQNFGIRRRLLEYDEVMNEQRKLVYGLRQKILEWKELRQTMMDWFEDAVAMAVDRERDLAQEEPLPPEHLASLIQWARNKFPIELHPKDLESLDGKEIEALILKRIKELYAAREAEFGMATVPRTQLIHYSTEETALPEDERIEMVRRKVAELGQVSVERIELEAETPSYGEVVIGRDPEQPVHLNPDEIRAGKLPVLLVGPVQVEAMRKLEHDLLLNIIDNKWKDHLQNMDVLREGIHLRSYAQKDPKIEYKKEGFDLFVESFNSMKEQATDLIFKIDVKKDVEEMAVENIWNEDEAQTIHEEAKSVYESAAEELAAGHAAMAEQSEHGGADIQAVATIRRTERQVRPNDPCPCGSGKKFKRCCGRLGGSIRKGQAKVGG